MQVYKLVEIFFTMNPFVQLLLEVGICVDPDDFFTEEIPKTPPSSPILANRPHHYDGETPVFTSDQINNSQPEQFGFTDYLVIDGEPIYALNWADEQQIDKRKRPVHRYCRKERFRFVLCQLLGCSGRISPKIFHHFINMEISHIPNSLLWPFLRSELKKQGWRIYNRIPGLVGELGRSKARMTNLVAYKEILDNFEKMHLVWPKVKGEFNRKYFPNLRYVALKLMRKSGIEPVIDIPLTHTPIKQQTLDEIYEKMWEIINKDV